MSSLTDSQLAMAEALPSMIWTATPEGVVDYVNHVFEDYTGETADQPGQIDWLSVVHPDDKAPTLAVWAKCIETSTPYQTEFRIIHKASNVYRWHYVAASPHFNERGEVVRWYGITTDIHDSKLAHKAVEQAHQELRRLLALQELETRLLERISAEHGLHDILDEITHTVDQIIPDVCSSILLVENGHLRHGSAPSLPKKYNEMIDGFPVGEGVGSCGTAAARGRPVIVSDILADALWNQYPDITRALGMRACWSTPVLNTDNKVLATFGMYYARPMAPSPDDLALIERICQFVRIVIERTRYREQAHAHEARFRAIAQASGDIIWEYNLNTAGMWYSEGMQRVFGHDPAHDAELGKALLATKYIHEDDHDAALAALESATQKGEPCEIEYRWLRANGQYAHVVNRTVVILDKNGNPARVVGSITDITEKKLLEEQLRHSQRLEAVGQLTSGIAHDFNNLLTIVLANAGQLAEELPSGSQQQSLAAMMKTAATKGAGLIRNLMAFSRQQELHARPVHVNSLIIDMRDLIKHTLGTHFSLHVHLQANPCIAFIDPSQLESALLNLTANARDAMNDAGALTIRTANVRFDSLKTSTKSNNKGTFVMVEVSDTGSGIDTQIKERIFDPFFTTKEVGKGSGLGLSMVYGFVKQSHGFVDIDSRLGHGTTLRLYFPLYENGTDNPPPNESRSTPDSTPTMIAETTTILLVEDEPMVRQMLVQQLTRMGYTVITANDGEEGLHELKEHPEIGLLFTDMMMPGGLDGYELAKLAQQHNPTIRVVLSSGYSGKLADAHKRTAEGYWVLPKPYLRAELSAVLKNALSQPA